MSINRLNNIQFSDIFDVDNIQQLQDLFSDATGVASIVTLPDGTPVTKPSNFCRLCNDIIRNTEKGLQNCIKSDSLLGGQKSSGMHIQPCLSGGLWDAGADITVGGIHIGNWLVGQVRNEELDNNRMHEYAREIGVDEDEFMDALNEVPVMTTRQFSKVLEMLHAFVNELSEKAYTNYQLKIQIAEREKTTELLKISEARFRNLLQDVPYISVQGYGPDGTTQYWNRASELLYGYSANEAIGQNLVDLIIPAGMKEHVKKGIEYMAETGEPVPSSELLLKRKDGTSVPVYSTHTILQLPGQEQELFCIDIDLSERKKAQEELLKSEVKFRNVFEHSVEGKSLTRIDGKLEANKAFCQLLGYEESELANSNWVDITHPDDIEKNENIIKSILSGELDTVRWEKRYFHKNGHIIWADISTTLQRDAEGKPQYFITSAIDITERKEAEAKLLNERLMLRTLIDNIPDSIYLKDLNCRKTLANKADVIYSGAESEAEILGKDDFDFYPKEMAEKFLADDLSVLQTGQPMLNSEGYIFDEKGNKRWLLSSKLPLRDKDNQVIGLVGIGRDITPRKLAEEALYESEEKYRLIFEHSPLGLLSFDEKGIIIACNSTFAKIIGSSVQNLIGLRMLDLPDVELVSAIQKSLAGSTGFYENFYHAVTSNKIVPVRALFAPIKSGFNKIKGGVGIIEDITDRKKAEDELSDQKYFFEQMFMQSSVSTQILDRQGWCEKVNPKMSELFGVEPTNIEGKVYNIFKDEGIIKNGVIRYLNQVFNEGKTAEWDMFFDSSGASFSQNNDDKAKKKIWAYYRAYPIFDKKGILSNVIIQHEDITERKKAENEMVRSRIKAEESEFKVRSMFENSLTGYVFFTTTGQILEANPAAFKILGTPSLEATKMINGLSFPPFVENGFSKDIIECIDENRVISNEMNYAGKRSSGGYLKYFLIPIVYYDEIIGVWANLQDLSDLWETQNDLKKAKEQAEESDRLKTAFLANMSHEIRTPMNGILGFAELLKTPDLTGEQQSEYLQIIKKSGDRMLNIINDIVDISKIESGQMKVSVSETKINEQTNFIFTFFKPEADRKGIHLSYKNGLPEKESIIKTDKEKIYAILTNLVKNAIKYTNAGSIEFGYTLKSGHDPATLEFYVKDTGIGVAKDRQSAIFERFIQADIADKKALQGAGLGLSITKAYVEMLGGKMSLDSEEEKGSVFYFTIPYSPQNGASTEQRIEVSMDEGMQENKKLKILIVEDDETSELLISMAVKIFSKEILKTRSGHETVETCRNNPDIDLILMDIKMPGIDGFEATRQIREFNHKVFIIAQTAYGFSADREKAITAGCNDYISKPINVNMLRKTIQKLVNV